MWEKVKEKGKGVKRWIVSHVLAKLGCFLIRLIIRTCHTEIDGLENYLKAVEGKGAILALWHSRLLLMPYFVAEETLQVPYAVVMSNSKDADALSVIARSTQNVDAIRVPHNAKAKALKVIVQAIKKGKVLIITPDGPRGPVCEVKQGLAFAALSTGKDVFPFTWESKNYWELPTWDKMRIPKPFSRIAIKVGDAVRAEKGKGKGKGKEAREILNKVIQESLFNIEKECLQKLL